MEKKFGSVDALSLVKWNVKTEIKASRGVDLRKATWESIWRLYVVKFPSSYAAARRASLHHLFQPS